MRREFRIEDVGLRWWGKCLLRRRARGVKLESKVKEIRRHQGVLNRNCISSEPLSCVWVKFVVVCCLQRELGYSCTAGGSGARAGVIPQAKSGALPI